MAIFLANRVHVEVSTSGTADFVVGAAISTAYQSFADASVPDAATFSYVAYTATQFECARGAYILGTTTVDRTAANVIAGSAGAGALTNFSTTPRLFIGPLAEDLVTYDDAGRVKIGSGAVDNFVIPTRFEITADSDNDRAILIAGYGANTDIPQLAFTKTRGADPTAHTIVQDGDQLASMFAYGSDGTIYRRAAFMAMEVDGTPGASDMPGRIRFATTSDEGLTTTERLRITSTGAVQPGANDGGPLGVSGTAWSDLFLASGGVINFAASDAVITHSSGVIDISTGILKQGGTAVALTGKQAVPVPAAAMTANTTSGPASGSAEKTTNKNMFVTLDFDTTTSESAQFSLIMPPSWDEGTITFQPVWSHPSTTTNFGAVWELSAVAVSDDDAGDVAFGTGQTSTDTGGTTDDIYIGPESSAITVGGTPAAGDFVMFKIARLPANGSDTLAVDARLHAIRLYMTTAAGNDA